MVAPRPGPLLRAAPPLCRAPFWRLSQSHRFGVSGGSLEGGGCGTPWVGCDGWGALAAGADRLERVDTGVRLCMWENTFLMLRCGIPLALFFFQFWGNIYCIHIFGAKRQERNLLARIRRDMPKHVQLQFVAPGCENAYFSRERLRF